MATTQAAPFAARLREERQRLGLSQQRLAKTVGVAKSTQVGYETGARYPDVEYLYRIAEAGIDLDYILFGASGATRLGEMLDWDLLAEVAGLMDDWASTHRVEVAAHKRRELLRMLYLEYAPKGHIDHEHLERTLRLVL